MHDVVGNALKSGCKIITAKQLIFFIGDHDPTRGASLPQVFVSAYFKGRESCSASSICKERPEIFIAKKKNGRFEVCCKRCTRHAYTWMVTHYTPDKEIIHWKVSPNE